MEETTKQNSSYETYMKVVAILQGKDNVTVVNTVQMLAGMVIKALADHEPKTDRNEVADKFIADIKDRLKLID